MKKTTLLLGVVLLIVGGPLSAQDWVSMMKDPSVNFFEVQKAFSQYEKNYREQYRNKNGIEPEKIPGYKQFKRWEWFMAPRISEIGERPAPDAVWKEMEKYRKGYGQQNAGNWTYIGASSVSGLMGAGRINFVRVHPTDSNTVFVGTPAGGLWKSINGGTSWAATTDWLPQVIGCSDLAIDPTNPNIMYLATGDYDGASNYSVGLLKSIDGGNTWNPTGLSFGVAQLKLISKVLIDPVSSNIILVAASDGLYRSNDSGKTFTLTQPGVFADMEFQPGNPNIVYSCGTKFYKSTDNGISWNQITSGLPAATSVSRMAISVTAADPTYIYLVAGLPYPYGTEGFYRSVTSGDNFTKTSTPGLGNQQWYDLAIASASGNKNEVLLGGQAPFLKSTNGGNTWSSVGSNTHVDYHDLIYASPSTSYVGSDGGVWRSLNNGDSWSNKSNGLQIAQIYGFGQSATNPNFHIHGLQDNGTTRYNGSWSLSMGGDGMLCFISWTNDQNVWGSSSDGNLQKSTNGGLSFYGCKGNITGTGAWVTPWIEDPITPNTVYAGFNDVWKHTAGGGSTGWTRISNLGLGSAELIQLAVSPADNKVIWATGGGKLFKTSDGGTNWTTISSIPYGKITYISCHDTDPKKAWITYSGFNSKNKVFQTSDQGLNWINLSEALPNIPINCITYVKGSNDGIYIGTDVGVYYRDASFSVWQPFSSGLPNVVVTQINIFYPTGKIRCSTYGRGIWESGLYVPGTYPPVANFTSQESTSCPGTVVKFFDQSSGQPSAWKWSFPGGNPSSSTLQNPSVTYNAPGTYSVTLISTNSLGVDTVSDTSYVKIFTSPYSAPTTQGDSTCTIPGKVNLSATGSGTGTLRWWDAPGGGNVVATSQTYSPTLSATTTFYVDENFPPLPDENVGALDRTMGSSANFTGTDIRGLYFDVLSPILLKKVDVYSSSAGNRIIEVLDPYGNTLVDTTIFVPASTTSPVQVNLNFEIYPGKNYFIKCRGSLVNLYRNSSGAVYPYTSSAVNITGANPDGGLQGYYYFFYNWQYTPLNCNTGRTPVIGQVGCTGTDDLFVIGSFTIFPNPNRGIFDLSFNASTIDDYTINIFNTLGQSVYKESLKNFSGNYSKEINITRFGSGVYMMSLSNSKHDTLKKIITY